MLSPGLLTIVLPLAAAVVCRAQVITEYPVSSPVYGAIPSIAAGPDGNLWFAELAAAKVGRITTAGVITEFPTPSGGGPLTMTAGPDGNLWFTVRANDRIGRITTTGTITEFPVPSGTQPYGIAAGPDGNLWFTAQFGNYIGNMSPAGVLLAQFPTPSALPLGITVGPDGNLWFAVQGGKIARVTLTGAITEYPVPTASAVVIDIKTGPDGNLWFTEAALVTNQIGKMTTSGVFTEFPLPAGTAIGSLSRGPDGNMWFGDLGYYNSPYIGHIGNITPTGTVSEYAVPTLNSWPTGIALGSDGNMWFTEQSGNKIGKLSIAPPVITPAVSGTVGTNGWYVSDVIVTWSVTSQGSAIISSTGCGTNTLTTNTTGVTLTCSATNAAGLSSSASVTIKIDKTPPVIIPAVTRTLGGNGWYTGNVTVSWTVSDPDSTIASSIGCAPALLSTDTAGMTLVCSAINGAGLSNQISVIIKIDKTPPMFGGIPTSCVLPRTEDKYVTAATLSATDVGSGLASFNVTAVSNKKSEDDEDKEIVITGSGLGPRVIIIKPQEGRVYTITASGADLAGNKSAKTFQCTVAKEKDDGGDKAGGDK